MPRQCQRLGINRAIKIKCSSRNNSPCADHYSNDDEQVQAGRSRDGDQIGRVRRVSSSCLAVEFLRSVAADPLLWVLLIFPVTHYIVASLLHIDCVSVGALSRYPFSVFQFVF